MSTLANITSLNLSLQTGGAALAVKAAGRLVAPARTVFVYGTADDVAPNFTTVAGAITYANSLTPIVTEPVVVRLFTKADGTPYDLAGLDSWTDYANDYIYFVSDFVRLNETSTLPTTLPAGQQVWYIDANGVETLWVGREDGSAWPAVGYKELRLNITQTSTNAPSVVALKNDFGGTFSSDYLDVGEYEITSSAGFGSTDDYGVSGGALQSLPSASWAVVAPTSPVISILTYQNESLANGLSFVAWLRVYP
jgi:hypothetical protein